MNNIKDYANSRPPETEGRYQKNPDEDSLENRGEYMKEHK